MSNKWVGKIFRVTNPKSIFFKEIVLIKEYINCDGNGDLYFKVRVYYEELSLFDSLRLFRIEKEQKKYFKELSKEEFYAELIWW